MPAHAAERQAPAKAAAAAAQRDGELGGNQMTVKLSNHGPDADKQRQQQEKYNMAIPCMPL